MFEGGRWVGIYCQEFEKRGTFWGVGFDQE